MIFPLLFSVAASLAPAVDAPLPAPVPMIHSLAAFHPAAPLANWAADPLIPAGRAGGHELASAAEVGFSVTALVHAEAAVLDEIGRGGFSGAALAIGRRGRVVVERGIGRVGWGVQDDQVDPDYNVYDLASLTKVVATTTAVMLLYEDGKLNLDAPVALYLPEFQGDGKQRVTVRHLLTHTSGLPAGADIWAPTPGTSLARAVATPLHRLPGAKVEYSDIGFVVLWAMAERVAGEPLYRMLDRRVYGPLEMRLTTFMPGQPCASCVPTERRTNGTMIRGRVHDPTAYRLGGIAGNAGLFSSAHDLARFAAMLASGGELDGVRVLRAETVEQFTRRQPGAGTRALGWDTPAPDGTGAGGLGISPRGFGHTGFTGTSLWVDPDRGSWVVLLSNRTFEPRASNKIQAIRRRLHDWVSMACDSGAVLSLATPAETASH